MVTQDALQSLRYEDKDLHTGLYNRRGFYSVVDYALDSCVRQHLYCTLVYIKFSDYKRLLEKFGKLIESEILAEFVTALKSTFRTSDVIARIGEDDFAVLTLHNTAFKIETVLIYFKQKIQTLNASRASEFKINYQVGDIKFDPEYVSMPGKLIDLIDKRMMESEYSRACSLQT